MVKFREIELSSGTKVILGRNAKNNDELVRAADKADVLLHTAAPGSPFCNVCVDVSKKDVKEAAVICARYSQDWRDNKQDVIVHKFVRSDVHKDKKMKAGTWGVRRFDVIKVKKNKIKEFEDGKTN